MKYINERLDKSAELKQYNDFQEILIDYYNLMCDDNHNIPLHNMKYSIYQMRELFIEKFQNALRNIIKYNVSQYDSLENHLESLKMQQRKLYEIRELVRKGVKTEKDALDTRNWACESFERMLSIIYKEVKEINKELEDMGLCTGYTYEDSDREVSGEYKHRACNLKYSDELLEKHNLHETIMENLKHTLKKALNENKKDITELHWVYVRKYGKYVYIYVGTYSGWFNYDEMEDAVLSNYDYYLKSLPENIDIEEYELIEDERACDLGIKTDDGYELLYGLKIPVSEMAKIDKAGQMDELTQILTECDNDIDNEFAEIRTHPDETEYDDEDDEDDE